MLTDMNASITRKSDDMNRNEYLIGTDITIIRMKGGKECLVSTEVFERLWPYTWCVEGTGYAMSRTSGQAVKMHRLIMGAKEGEYVDHIDGNPLNNTLGNLRLCKKQQNEFNQKIRTDNTSGYKGVSLLKESGRYRAYINKNRIRYELGIFLTKEEAALAYNRKAVELFGEYARLNMVGGKK